MIATLFTLSILTYIAIKEIPNMRDPKDPGEWGCSLIGALMMGAILYPLVGLVLIPFALLAKWIFGIDVPVEIFYFNFCGDEP